MTGDIKKLFIFFLLVAAIVVYAYTRSDSPHTFSETECLVCHVDYENNPRELREPVTNLCRKCHAKTIRTSSHPVDLEPATVRVPADLPLKDGKITCNTCHNIHLDSKLAYGQKSYFLRRPTVDLKYFCLACHRENLLNPGHRELTAIAHMGSKYRVIDKTEPLDPLSIACIQCHDGNVASSIDVEMGSGIWKHLQIDHPVGIHYQQNRMEKGGLRAASKLDKRIKFFGGRIGCGTCHDMYSKIPGKLVMENDESRLCTSCHENK